MTIDPPNNEPNFLLFKTPCALSHVIMQMSRRIMSEGEKCQAVRADAVEVLSMAE